MLSATLFIGVQGMFSASAPILLRSNKPGIRIGRHRPRTGKGKIRLTDEFILETHGLTKEFAGFFAVREVALKVRRGSIHALIGPNGAGKSNGTTTVYDNMGRQTGTIRSK